MDGYYDDERRGEKMNHKKNINTSAVRASTHARGREGYNNGDTALRTMEIEGA